MKLRVKRIYKYSVIVMFSFITNAFAMEKPPQEAIGAMRSVDISGNVLTFSMPENFSKDMPAAPLLEKINLSDEFKETLLIQRWWDIKKPGFWAGQIGTVMMTMNLIPVPQNLHSRIHEKVFDIRDRVDFMEAIITTLQKRYSDSGDLYYYPELVYVFGDKVSGAFRESIFNQQKWTSYSVQGPEAQLIVTHALPVTESAYLEVALFYSPNDGVLPRDFRDVAYNTTALVEQSLHLEYKKGNLMKELVERKWINTTANEALEEKADILVPRLFSEEVVKQLEEYKEEK